MMGLMSRPFKIFLILILTLMAAIALTYTLNETKISLYSTDKNPPCPLDCGSAFTDYLDKTEHIGFPLAYKDKESFRGALSYNAPQTSEPNYNKLYANYVTIIGVSEAVAGLIIWRQSRRHDRS
jgi:hypothetical protein